MTRRTRTLGALSLVGLGFAAAGCDPPLPPDALASFGPAQQQDHAPPALSGGTLLALHDGATVVASDPDGDAVYAVDLASRTVRWRVALSPGDEPGRLAEDDAGHVHVALRRGGAVVTVDTASGAVVARRAVCPAPRGIAFDAANHALAVACEGGELVTLPASGSAAPVSYPTRADLRDAVYDGDQLVLSTFRAAEFVRPDPTLVASPEVVSPANYAEDRVTAISRQGVETHARVTFVPDVAWRTIALPGGGVAMLHQRAESSVISAGQPVTAAYYGSTPSCTVCSCSAVHSTITVMGRGAHAGALTSSPVIPLATLPVDLAVDHAGSQFAIIAAANYSVPRLPEVMVVNAGEATAPATPGACIDPVRTARPTQGEATSVAFDSSDRLIVQTRSPATLWFEDTGASVVLDPTDRHDTGHEIFHGNSGSFIACASCHPEGGDDGHTWNFTSLTDPRRTIALRGGHLLETAPFHWRGELADMDALMNDIFVARMAGPPPSPAQTAAVGHWLDAQPLPPEAPPADPAAVDRGRALFESASVGCTTCHSGDAMTNNQTVDVGTGGMFQVPSLRGLRFRPPYMHTGCAATIAQRFDPHCGGTNHGNTASLTADQVSDLVAYLGSL